MSQPKIYAVILVLTVLSIPQFSMDIFSIYFATKYKAKIDTFILTTDVKTIKLEPYPWLQDIDILSYDKESHTLELTKTGWRDFRELDIKHGSVFVVCVGKTPIYWGVALYGMQSAPYQGIVIIPPWQNYTPGEYGKSKHSIKIQCGFPDEGYCKIPVDRRSDERILKALRESGKLRE